MEKKGLFGRFKTLSKPTGAVNWSQGLKAFILIVVATLLATLLKFNNGIEAIIMVTLLATIILDISMPIKKVAILGLLGFIMTTLAFLCVSLSVHNLAAFIIFSVLWAFFSISMYIFGNMEGSIGFSFFLTYFVAVLIVNLESTPIEWISYTTLAYLVASTLLIPKLWMEKRKIRQLVSVGFNPESTIQSMVANMHILSGISLNSVYYEFFKFGGYYKILRSYSELIIARLNPHDQKYFTQYLELTDDVSNRIGQNFQSMNGSIDEKIMDSYELKVDTGSNEVVNEQIIQVSRNIQKILNYCNSLLNQNPEKGHKTIKTKEKSFKEVISANFNLENMYMRHAVRFTLAMTIGLIFIYLTRERSAIWITMGILIIIKPDITSTVDNLIQRVGFNFIAIVVAIILGFLFPHYILVWFAVLMLFLFRAFYPTYMGLSVMAMTVFIVLVWPTGTVYGNAISRIVDISIGGIIAFICAYVILPNRININLPEQLTKTITANLDYGLEMVKITGNNFDKNQATVKLQNYMLQENNLEAGIKKLEDTFNDVNSDLSLYQNFLSMNIKLTADLTALAEVVSDTSMTISNKEVQGAHIQGSLMELRELSRNWDTNKVLDINLTSINENSDDLAQLINWIYSDIQLIFNGLEVAHKTDLFKRYTNLS
ncbi:MAG: FUSC family protein [Methanobacterium sp. ERen5]|nr:MAG: FUSC family protein [Methanobacterium sp. ERen5]